MTYKSELDFARQAARAYRDAYSWACEALNALAAGTVSERERAERCRKQARRHCLEGRLAQARADAICNQRHTGSVDHWTQVEITRVSHMIEAEAAHSMTPPAPSRTQPFRP